MAEQYRRKALYDALGVEETPEEPLQQTGPVGPGMELPPPVETTAAAPAPIAPKPFQSGNASVSGYLQDAMKSFAPTIHGIKDEAGRKSALKDYLTSIAPEVQSRGGTMTDIGLSDKARVDGRLIDFYRDIEGAAEPQFLDVTDEASQPQMGGGNAGLAGAQAGIDGLLQGDPMAAIRQALEQLMSGGDKPNLAALLGQLGAR